MKTPQSIPPGTQTLARGLTIVAEVARGVRTLKDLQEATKLPRSSVHRMAQLLVAMGYLSISSDHLFSLGPTFIEYGFKALYANPLPTLAKPELEDLAERTGDTVHLAIEDDKSVLYMHKISGQRGAEMRSRVGYRMPLSITGIGKALILDRPAEWETIYLREHPGASIEEVRVYMERMRTYASRDATYDLEENELSIRCVAAPIRDGSERIVAAVSLSAIRAYMPAARMKALVPVLKNTAAAIAMKLGYAR